MCGRWWDSKLAQSALSSFEGKADFVLRVKFAAPPWQERARRRLVHDIMVHANNRAGYGQRMPFGKYIGECLCDIRDAVRVELAGRGQRKPEPEQRRYPVEAIISRARRELSLQHHPDRGGDGAVMRGINLALDRVAQLMEGAT